MCSFLFLSNISIVRNGFRKGLAVTTPGPRPQLSPHEADWKAYLYLSLKEASSYITSCCLRVRFLMQHICGGWLSSSPETEEASGWELSPNSPACSRTPVSPLYLLEYFHRDVKLPFRKVWKWFYSLVMNENGGFSSFLQTLAVIYF